MKKLFFAGALCMMLCVCASGMAGTMFNVCLSKECLTEQEAANQAIQTKPKGFKVTRQSVIPWDGLFLSNWKMCRRRQSPLTTHG